MNLNPNHTSAEQSRIERILDFLPYPFLVSEVQGSTYVNIHVNKKFIEEIGYSIHEIPDIDSWFLCAYPDPMYRNAIVTGWHALVKEALRKGEDSVMMRAIIHTKHKGDKWYEVKSSVSSSIQMVAFVNITEVMTKERELERLNENKNQTLSILAHDVRGPLSNLNTMTRWMLEGNFDRAEFLERLSKINEKSSQVLEFIDTTLLWTRSNFNSVVLRIEDVDLGQELDKMLRVYENVYQAKQLSIIQQLGATSVVTDREIITIVLRNLISNAIKFSNAGGNIIISSNTDGPAVNISVKDTGIGMSSDMLDRIQLDHYSSTPGTREEKGLGIGLKLCRQLIKKLDGKLIFKSQPGTGTEVIIQLPLQNRPVAAVSIA
ncbi:MAG TPA: HAMP domain-containing sensor histidine kinase [Chryseosolibacter sp.]